MSTTFRMAELAWLGEGLRSLDDAEAQAAFNRASRWMSDRHQSLDERQFPRTDTIIFKDIDACRAWLANRIPTADGLQIIFGPREVCAMSAPIFLEHRPDMFVPSRDDVIVTNQRGSWVLFYYHEDEFQFARIEPA